MSRELKERARCTACRLHLDDVFPKDYPDDWKFCCICLVIAEEIATGVLEEGSWSEQIVKIVRDRITLVK